ncbi:YdbL family protein [Zavarzinia compransoris]|uniref:YdbL family protein n=1 Tax=Zavarzinia marina TaxID=2911065 RepID=UPI001F1ED493|nr:DUF1318 domain-containing protein [Zavarzinia marina]MCF4164770.1 YdbL family protein [Zavarzinia marina]
MRSSEPVDRRALLRLSGALVLGAVAVATLPASPAEAKPLDAPRAAGQAGEAWTGYAVARPGAPADVVALIDRVNVERRALYTQRAKSQNVPVEAVAEIYAAQIAASLPKGTWMLAKDGRWSQK